MSRTGSMEHLVVVGKKYLESILRGEKKIECRLMSWRCAPYGRVERGDKLFFKVVSGPVRAVAKVADVRKWDNLTTKDVRKLRSQYNQEILGTEEYWRRKMKAKYAVLIWLTKVEEIVSCTIKKRDRSAWVILSKEKSYGLLG